MSKFGFHLRLVASNTQSFSRDAFARQFRQTMTDHIRAHTDGTNVNTASLLATDYLNHFNEAIMLLEMLPDAPEELIADLAQWRHETYEDHFHRSGFREKNLALAGYRNAPQEVRDAFDTIVGDIADELSLVLKQAQEALKARDLMTINLLRMNAVPSLKAKIETASAIVNGRIATRDEARADARHDAGLAQAEIDALFD